MKAYPSIPLRFEEFTAYVFDKIDGSNLRFEWTRKKGWGKYGTRHHLFDETDPTFGSAISIFQDRLAADLEKVFVDQRWDQAVAFAEFWGRHSLAGYHASGDPKNLTLFDVDVYKKGLLPPGDFLKLFGHLNIPNYLGQMRWTRGFVERVYRGEVEDITFEGVVGKAPGRQGPTMAKAKTQAWREAVRKSHDELTATKLLES